ncbi:phage tail assembly chaperone [Sphingomonas sp. KRR8]|uniref:phage tail assembly chaperone n=1 Tax=Sphingomonas sp. KRR8 TaxID=2942996 RepID=UPI00202221A4|nr:phage tail assembly chaperone [Sphingomonas sp. KRR8]URD62209.1 phage tail assembly chaperone [Sphingomonas sp. KRR8]
MTFAESAQRCWRLAAHVLGWSPSEFWNSTPAELAQSLPFSPMSDVGVSKSDLQALTARFPDSRN